MWHSIVGCIVACTLSLLVVPRVAEAQPTGKVYRIGWPAEGARYDEPFLLKALHELGYVEGHNLVVERRSAETQAHLPALATELVTRQVDLLLTFGTRATRAAQQATATIPIVFRLAADPVQSGLVASDARPGGNLTGVAVGLYDDQLLELLKAAVPGMQRVACPCRRDPANPSWVRIADAARVLGVDILDIAMQGPDDFTHFFAAARRADAVLVPDVVWLNPHFTRLGELAAQSQLPAISVVPRFAEAGGLLAYVGEGPRPARTAAQVDKIFQGGKPADIPVEHTMRFTLIINLKTAKALGLTIPPAVLLQADKVIQ